jgi:cation:H+ antiporter
LAGLASLLGGAHFLVRSSSELALRFGVPAIFIGVTVVAFATSAPEVAVSLDAVLDGRTDLAIGNVLGSNIANILLILGLSAIVAPVAIKKRIIQLEVPVMILFSAIVFSLALDGRLQPFDGMILLALFAGFMGFQIHQARKERMRAGNSDKQTTESIPFVRQLVMLAVGLALLVLGAHWLVESAIVIARYWGLSELVIGLTVIAIGTSLPEVATSVLAARQNEADLSVGNVVGSNIFNLLLVLGLAAVFSPAGLAVSDAALALDFPFVIAVSIACLPIFFTGHTIERWEGAVFLGYYAAYLLFLFMDATQHQFLPLFNTVMAIFVAPITILTLLVFTFRSWKKTGV